MGPNQYAAQGSIYPICHSSSWTMNWTTWASSMITKLTTKDLSWDDQIERNETSLAKKANFMLGNKLKIQQKQFSWWHFWQVSTIDWLPFFACQKKKKSIFFCIEALWSHPKKASKGPSTEIDDPIKPGIHLNDELASREQEAGSSHTNHMGHPHALTLLCYF